MLSPNKTSYLQSLARELLAQSDRVRDLIGDAHWLHEGRHKEHLLTEVVRRHLPDAASASTGFVVSPNQVLCSREQDILVVSRSTEAPVFHQGGLVMAFPRTVLAALSVKTAFTSSTLLDSAASLLTVKKVAAASGVPPDHLWCGAYFFRDTEQVDKSLALRWYAETLKKLDCQTPFGGGARYCPPIDVAASSANQVLVASHDPGGAPPEVQLRLFNCEESLATAVFLTHLIDHLAVRLGASQSDFIDFADVPQVELFRQENVPFVSPA